MLMLLLVVFTSLAILTAIVFAVRESRWWNARVDLASCNPTRAHFANCGCAMGRKVPMTVGEDGKPVWDTLIVEMDDGLITQPNPNAPVILYCHGNKRNICSCLHMTAHFGNAYPGCTVVYFDYQGFGHSQDRTPVDRTLPYSPQMLGNDLINVFNRVKGAFSHRPIFIYAHSFGAMVAANVIGTLAGQIRGLILEGAPNKPSRIIPWKLGGPIMGWMTRVDTKYPIGERLERLPESLHVLFIHSKDDRVVPWTEFNTNLYSFRQRRAGRNVAYIEASGPHNKIELGPDDYKKLNEFFHKACQ